MLSHKRRCSVIKEDGSSCRAPPLRESSVCRMHSPEHAAEVAEGRRLGGMRRRRETTVSLAYDFEGLGDVEQIRRVLEIAVLDTLGQENSLQRSRALAYLAHVALRAYEGGEVEERLRALESAVGTRRRRRR